MVNDDLAMIAFVEAHAMDDRPRLIYADWLDDHDEPELAAFVRLQVEVHRVPSVDPRRMELRAREKAAWDCYKRKWADDLAAGKIGRGHFTRGILTKPAAFPAAHFVERSHRWAPGLPVRSLRLLNPGGLAERIAATPFLARLPRLDIGPEPLDWWRYEPLREGGKTQRELVEVPDEAVLALCDTRMPETVSELWISGVAPTRGLFDALGLCSGLGGVTVSIFTIPGRSWSARRLNLEGAWFRKGAWESFPDAVKRFLAEGRAAELVDALPE